MYKLSLKYNGTVQHCQLLSKLYWFLYSELITIWGRHSRDRMVVGFTTTCAISAYHH